MSRMARRLYDLWVRVGLGRSLFGRLLTAYTGLAVVGLLVIGLLLSYLAGGYIRAQKFEELTRAARRVSLTVQQLVDASSLGQASEDLDRLVWLLSSTLNVGIVLFTDDGSVVAASAAGESLVINSVPPDITQRVLAGRTATLHTRLVPDGPPVLVAAVPLGEDEPVPGGVLVYTPVADLRAAVARFRETILWVALAVSLLSIGVGSYVSWTISRPLRQLRRIVADIGAGNYPAGTIAAADSEDEIGELAAAILSLGDRLAAADRHRRQAEESRRRLLADVSHELRTPLTTIRGFTEALIDELDDNPQARRRHLRLIHEQTLHLARLVDDLLELSRLEAGDIRLVRMPVDLGALVHSVAERMRPAAERRDVRLLVVAGTEGQDQVIGDPDRLEQVITNLVANAVDVSTGGEVTLTVRADDAEVCLEVRDTGPGIDPTDLPYIWQRFYRGRKGGDRGGTGLGLAIVRQLVELHGGRVSVETQPGQGSRFFVYLPRASVTSRS